MRDAKEQKMNDLTPEFPESVFDRSGGCVICEKPIEHSVASVHGYDQMKGRFVAAHASCAGFMSAVKDIQFTQFNNPGVLDKLAGRRRSR